MPAAAEPTHPRAEDLDLAEVLAALGHPVRLDIVRKLASGERTFCGEVVPDLPRSSVTHHLKTLREGGVICQRPQGRKLYLALRRDDLESRFPGLLELVLACRSRPLDSESDEQPL